MKQYTISEAARILHVDRRTLQRWIRDKRIPVPSVRNIAGVKIKFWGQEEFEILKEYKAREYWRKPKKSAT